MVPKVFEPLKFDCINEEQRTVWHFAHIQIDINPHFLRMLQGTFSLGAAHKRRNGKKKKKKKKKKKHTFWYVRPMKSQSEWLESLSSMNTFCTSRKFAYIILTPLNPTFI